MSTVDFRALLGTLVREEVDFVVVGALDLLREARRRAGVSQRALATHTDDQPG